MVRRREIGLGQWDRYLSDKVESLVKAGTLEWEARVKDETPGLPEDFVLHAAENGLRQVSAWLQLRTAFGLRRSAGIRI